MIKKKRHENSILQYQAGPKFWRFLGFYPFLMVFSQNFGPGQPILEKLRCFAISIEIGFFDKSVKFR